MNFYAVGFVAVLGVVGLGVDYQQQSINAGVGLGELSLGDYVATYSARYHGMQAERAAEKAEDARRTAWREGPKPFLPEAPAGWTRRAFDAADNSAIIPGADFVQRVGTNDDANYLAGARLPRGETVKSVKPSAGIERIMGKRSAADVMKEVAGRSWVYEHGDETVFVEATKSDPPNLNSLVGNVAASITATQGFMSGREAGYGVIGGVPYIEALNDKGKPSNHYRILKATMGFGQEVHIRVHANASAASTREILEAIDYDGLNGMMKTPMASVGNAVTPPPGVDEAALAEEMDKLRTEFDGLLAAEAQYRVHNMNAGALVINTVAQGYGAGAGGIVDLTGGKAVSMESLIYAGFRKGLRDLMAGGDGRMAMNEIGAALGSAMAQDSAARKADAANAPPPVIPQMSAGLAAELGAVVASDTAAPDDTQTRPTAAAPQAPAPQAPVQQAQAPKGGGGWMSKIGGLFSGGSGSAKVASAKASRESVEIRQMGGGGSRLAGGGCGAGKFCEANAGD